MGGNGRKKRDFPAHPGGHSNLKSRHLFLMLRGKVSPDLSGIPLTQGIQLIIITGRIPDSS